MKLLNAEHLNNVRKSAKSGAFALVLALAAAPLIVSQIGCTGRNGQTTTTGSVAPTSDRSVGDTSVDPNATTATGSTASSVNGTTTGSGTAVAPDANAANSGSAGDPNLATGGRAPASADTSGAKMESTATTQKTTTTGSTGSRSKAGVGSTAGSTTGSATDANTTTATTGTGTTGTASTTGTAVGDQTGSASGGAPYHGAKAGTTNKNLSQMSPGTTDQHTDQNPVDSSAPTETARHGKRK